MSYWIEIHCDVRSDTPDPSKPPLHNLNVCYEMRNDNPAAMVVDMRYGAAAVAKKAKQYGYVRRGMREGGPPLDGLGLSPLPEVPACK